jgi:hypothetical protein
MRHCHGHITTVLFSSNKDKNHFVGISLLSTSLLSARPLSGYLHWRSREEVVILVGSVGRRRRCFIIHLEDIQMLGINVCFLLQSQHNHRENEGMTLTPILQTRQNWRNHLANKTTVRQVFFFRMCSRIKVLSGVYIFFLCRTA